MGIMVTGSQFHIGASPGPSDSHPTLGLTLMWRLWSPPEYHQNRVTLVPLWDSPGAGALVLNWASTGPGESTPHLGLGWTLLLFSHLESMGQGYSVPHLGLTWT